MSHVQAANVARFLLRFSYVGTHFSGVAAQNHTENTVHHHLESSLNKLSDSVGRLKSRVWISSRTDAGVHALENTAHCDILLNEDASSLPSLQTTLCKRLKDDMNECFVRNNTLIRYMNTKAIYTYTNNRNKFVQKIKNNCINNNAYIECWTWRKCRQRSYRVTPYRAPTCTGWRL